MEEKYPHLVVLKAERDRLRDEMHAAFLTHMRLEKAHWAASNAYSTARLEAQGKELATFNEKHPL